MSDDDDWNFAGADDAKMTIRAAIRYFYSKVLPTETAGQLNAKTAHRIAAIMLPPANRPDISIN
jgi:hypothetical protein